MSKQPHNPRRYEVDTLRGRSIVIFLLGFVGCMALSFWVVKKTLRHLDASTPAPAMNSLVGPIRETNNAPLLQPTEAVDHTPAYDLQILLSREDDTLAKLGWSVDRNTHQAVISDALIQKLIRKHESEAGK